MKYLLKIIFLNFQWDIYNLKISDRINTLEAYSEPYQISKIKLFAKLANGLWSSTIFIKSSIFDVYMDLNTPFFFCINTGFNVLKLNGSILAQMIFLFRYEAF